MVCGEDPQYCPPRQKKNFEEFGHALNLNVKYYISGSSHIQIEFETVKKKRFFFFSDSDCYSDN